MTDDFSPPIASPHGAGTSTPQSPDELDGLDLTISVSLSEYSAFRSACVALCCPLNYGAIQITALAIPTLLPVMPATLRVVFPGDLLLLCLVAFNVFMIGVFTVWHLWMTRQYEIEVQQKGLSIYYFKRDDIVLIPWSKVALILHVNGDVLVTSGWNYCLIPRDCFDSCDQSWRFARLLRQLRDASRAV